MKKRRWQDVLYNIICSFVMDVSKKIKPVFLTQLNPVVKKLSPHTTYRGCPGSFSHSGFRTKKVLSGSITVEAALIVPFVFLALLSFSSLFSVQRMQNRVQLELEQAVGTFEASGTKIYSVEALLKEKMVVHWNEREPYPVCYVQYKRNIPFLGKHLPGLKVYQQIAWNDYSGRSMVPTSQKTEKDIVYIAENSRVYHRNRYCTYLKMKIEAVSEKMVSAKRNLSGEKYYPCHSCIQGREIICGNVYITAYGNRYHKSKTCSQLYRKVKEVPLNQTGGMPACSKCGSQ